MIEIYNTVSACDVHIDCVIFAFFNCFMFEEKVEEWQRILWAFLSDITCSEFQKKTCWYFNGMQ